MLLKEHKIKSIILEYTYPEKKTIITLVNKIMVAIDGKDNEEQLGKDLDKILEFYRYYKNGLAIEDKIVLKEFQDKLNSFVSKNNLVLQ